MGDSSCIQNCFKNKIDKNGGKYDMKDFWGWLVEHEENAQMYSCLVATAALLFSILTFVISNIISKKRLKKDREISEKQYLDQINRYEKQLQEEKRYREEDKKEIEERNRISEQPYFVFKKSKATFDSQSSVTILRMEFVNKGRGAAYEIIPDMECIGKTLRMKEIQIRRYEAVQDPIAMVGELFVISWYYECNGEYVFQMQPSIRFCDASGRNYKQTFNIDVVNKDGGANIKNYAQPQLCSE